MTRARSSMPPSCSIGRGGRAARMRGFTLLEVMLAFALLAFAMSMLIGMLANGLHQVTRAEDSTRATLYAQSLIEPIGTLEPIAVGASQGYFDGNRYRWQMQIAPVDDPAPRAPIAAAPPVQDLTPPRLYRIALDVSWGAGQRGQVLHFVTLRARMPPPAIGGAP
jgi:general secretion pathway protein I